MIVSLKTSSNHLIPTVNNKRPGNPALSQLSQASSRADEPPHPPTNATGREGGCQGATRGQTRKRRLITFDAGFLEEPSSGCLKLTNHEEKQRTYQGGR